MKCMGHEKGQQDKAAFFDAKLRITSQRYLQRHLFTLRFRSVATASDCQTTTVCNALNQIHSTGAIGQAIGQNVANRPDKRSVNSHADRYRRLAVGRLFPYVLVVFRGTISQGPLNLEMPQIFQNNLTTNSSSFFLVCLLQWNNTMIFPLLLKLLGTAAF